MPESSAIRKLQDRIDRRYEKHSAARVAMAASFVGVSAIGSCLLTYVFTSDGFLAAGVLGLVSLVTVNLGIFMIVPPVERLKASRANLIAAVQSPERIKGLRQRRVVIEDREGRAYTLNRLEQSVWESVIVPHVMQVGLGSREHTPGKRRFTASERKYIETKRREVAEMEAALRAERDQLDTEKAEIETRNAALKEAEDMVIVRLTQVEEAEANIEQLREDLTAAETRQARAEEGGALVEKEAQLREKEAELERLKRNLADDREIVEAQKTELNQLKGELLRSGEAASDVSEASAASGADDAGGAFADREKALEKRMREMEALAADLESRSNYVKQAEDSLIERLNQLTEREASVEQSEVEAGLRKD